jgi:Acyl-protein synthetase, LuxE
MMGHVSVLRGDGRAEYFLGEDSIDIDGFIRALDGAIAEQRAVCITGTAFAFVALVDELAARERVFRAPPGSRIMETGGFKGRAHVVERAELYALLAAATGIPESSIVAEYGMTELLSQYYDEPGSRASETRIKAGPPWLRTLVVDANGSEVPEGEAGFLRHVDLANRSSVVAIDTEDRGYRAGSGFVLLGRDMDAPVRGCSLDAEDLIAGSTPSR